MTVYAEHWAEHWPALSQIDNTATDMHLHHALWLRSGDLTVNGINYRDGDGFHLPDNAQLQSSANAAVAAIRFVFATASVTAKTLADKLSISTNTTQRKLIAHKTYSTNLTKGVLRLDRVDFPPGAIAYRHTHPGGGFRYLTQGSLKLHSDHDVQNIGPEDAWFEPANSPVKAVADNTQPSQFVRLLVLPTEYENRSSFTLASEADADKPRLQSNHRFFDKPIELIKN